MRISSLREPDAEVYLGKVTVEDFRRNPRGELGTRTATLHKDGIQKIRRNWIYKLWASPLDWRRASLGIASHAMSK